MIIRQNKNIVDYIFWFVLILFTNPGGIQDALNISKLSSGINLNDFLFVILTSCFLFVILKKQAGNPFFTKIGISIVIFVIYYFIVFGYYTPLLNDPTVDVKFNFIKLRFAFYSFALFFFVFTFWQRSWQVFVKLFVYSSVIILLLFLQSFFTGHEILPTEIVDRGFITIDRNLLLSYGLMPLLTQIGAALIIFNLKTKYKIMLILGFIMINIAWLVSLTRRHILELFITLLIAVLIFNYIKSTDWGFKIKIILRSILGLTGLLFVTYLIIPNYFYAGIDAIENTIYVIQYGEKITGGVEERLTLFSRYKMVEEFEKSPLLGTGFDNIWRTKEGDQLGYEASDYPFQSALAMAGILGCLMFLPVYLILIKSLYTDIKFLKENKIVLCTLHDLFLLSFIVYFLFTIIQYMNWFFPVSNAGKPMFFIILGFYFAERNLFYQEVYSSRVIENEV